MYAVIDCFIATININKIISLMSGRLLVIHHAHHSTALLPHVILRLMRGGGAENARLENAGPKLQGWKTREKACIWTAKYYCIYVVVQI